MKNEILLSNYNLPLEINLIEINDVYTNWHKELKVIYVLKGHLFIDIKSNQFLLEENQFIFVNSYDISSIYPQFRENSLFLEFLIDSNAINRIYDDFSYIKFKCYSTNSNFEFSKYNTIRELLGKILNNVFTNNAEKNILIFNSLTELLLFVINNFKLEESLLEKDFSNKNRLIKIFDFLEKNYDDENLSVHDISNYVELSPQHLLKIFRENLGITLADYLNSLRIKKSLNDLLYTNKSIIEISVECGFNSSKSYHRIFKKNYKTTPGEYKKKFKTLQSVKENKENKENYMNKEEIIENFSKYYSYKNNTLINQNKNELNLIELNFNKLKVIKFKHYWKKTMSFGKACEGLRGDIQSQIKEIKSDFNPDYIRFTGIFNEEMHIYNEDSLGKVHYDYSYIDKLTDFLIKLHLKPYINIGFMPKKLAEKEEYIGSSSINISYPKNIKKWKELVSNLIRHFIEKYGEKEVESWYFEIWNNPNLKGLYWKESDEKFYLFFSETYSTIKSISHRLKVGGPSANFNINQIWLNNFIKYLNFKNIKIDFFSFSSYEMSENPEPFSNSEDVNGINNLKGDGVSFKEFSSDIKKNYEKKIELIMCEWNLTTSSFNLYNDNCYKAAYIVDTVLNNINTVNQMIYWTATENKMGANILYGGIGLFTTNNLKKASYNAFLLLNKLGDTLISKGKNHFITTRADSVQVMLYNYDKINEKNNFNKVKEIQINMQNFNHGKYRITKYYLNSLSGSIYEAWKEMGAPDKITDEIYNLLKGKEKMNMKVEVVDVINSLNIKESLDSNSIVFLDINKIYEPLINV